MEWFKFEENEKIYNSTETENLLLLFDNGEVYPHDLEPWPFAVVTHFIVLPHRP